MNGATTNEIFSFLKRELPFEDGSREVRWNFGKFLVGRDGMPAKRFGSKDAPLVMEDDIRELLSATAIKETPRTPLAKDKPRPSLTPQGVAEMKFDEVS